MPKPEISILEDHAEIRLISKAYGTVVSKVDTSIGKAIRDGFLVREQPENIDVRWDQRAKSFYLHLRSPFTKRTVPLHKLIYMLNGNYVPFGLPIDHENQDSLDNLYKNLRCVSLVLNAVNTSKFSGVTEQSKGGKWFARIKLGGRRVQLGTFDTRERAEDAYASAKRKFLSESDKNNLHVLQKAPQRYL